MAFEIDCKFDNVLNFHSLHNYTCTVVNVLDYEHLIVILAGVQLLLSCSLISHKWHMIIFGHKKSFCK